MNTEPFNDPYIKPDIRMQCTFSNLMQWITGFQGAGSAVGSQSHTPFHRNTQLDWAFTSSDVSMEQSCQHALQLESNYEATMYN